MEDSQITYFAKTDYRNRETPFGIKAEDRTRHMYVIGKTGMGKSTVLENLAIQDIQNGNGLAFIDPHGKSAELLLDYVPENRIKDVMYFAPFDMEHPISFNVMEDIGPDRRHLVVNGLMSTFEKIWVDAWSARMAYILNNTLLALLEYPNSTLLGINRMLSDKEYRKQVVQNIQDPSVKSFWLDEFAKYTDRFAAEATPAIQNKVGQFTSNPLIRNIVGQNKSSFDLRKMMDEKKIVIVNLSKGRVGEGNANLLGSMFVTKVYLAAMSRADTPDAELKKLPHFNLYVDEFQSFANKSFADILSEARKYKLNLTIAHQYIEQMEEEVRAAVFGNVGTLVTFRVGATDAEYLEKEFAPVFTAEDLVNLGIYQIYLKLMINGVSSSPFSAKTLPPIRLPSLSWKEEILNSSRSTFANPRAKVEADIREWHKPVNASKVNLNSGPVKDKIQNQSFTNQNFQNKNSHFEPKLDDYHKNNDHKIDQNTPKSDLDKKTPDFQDLNSTFTNNDNSDKKENKPFAEAFSKEKVFDAVLENKKDKDSLPKQQKIITKDKKDGKEGTLRDLLVDVLAKDSLEKESKEKVNFSTELKAKDQFSKDVKNQEVDPEVLKALLHDEEGRQN